MQRKELDMTGDALSCGELGVICLITGCQIPSLINRGGLVVWVEGTHRGSGACSGGPEEETATGR